MLFIAFAILLGALVAINEKGKKGKFLPTVFDSRIFTGVC